MKSNGTHVRQKSSMKGGKNKVYDFLIVGAGLAGSTFAYLANKSGYKCLVIEKADTVGGMCKTEKINDIIVHKHGAHIFRTSDKQIWDFVNSISEFDPFINTPKARYRDKLFSLPINMNTYHEMWGVITPEQAIKKIEEQCVHFEKIENLEQYVLSKAGKDIYKYLIKEYTEKQWGKPCNELSPDIMKRIPLRMTYDNNYYDAKYQGIPIEGYTAFMEKMLEGIETRCGVDFIKQKREYEKIAKTIIYTGPIDDLLDNKYGSLEYRSLQFEHKYLPDVKNYQGVAVVNQTSDDVKHTRVIEHKHFSKTNNAEGTMITFETPCEYKAGLEKYYSVNDTKNQKLFELYSKEVPKNMIMLGRLAEYKYYDMADTIQSAFRAFESFQKNKG